MILYSNIQLQNGFVSVCTHTAHEASMHVHYVSPEMIQNIFLYAHLYPSAQAAQEEIKLPPPLDLVHRDPNGFGGALDY